jgi:hypothetical protein
LTGIKICGYEFLPAPDKWDRLYSVDFYLKIGSRYVGIQVKPPSYNSPSVYGKFKGNLRNQHRKFLKDFGGKVYIIYKDEKGNHLNRDICSEIHEEIKRIKGIALISATYTLRN